MKNFTKEYLEWSKAAQKAQIDKEMSNKMIAEELGYSRQFVTAVVNGRKRISSCDRKNQQRTQYLKTNCLYHIERFYENAHSTYCI